MLKAVIIGMMMKRLLLIFAVLFAIFPSLVGAVDVKKTVEGQALLGFGESLNVTIKIDTETQLLKLNQLTDPVPEGFAALITETSYCSQKDTRVTCDFGSATVNGTYEVNYELVAINPVEKVPIKKATLHYTDPETPTFQLTKSSNSVSELYAIGPPMINITKAVLVDGTHVNELEVLPNSRIKIEFRLQNVGAIDAEVVELAVTPPTDWSLSRTPERGFVLGAGESKLISVELSGPSIEKFSSGAISEISAIATWSGGNRTYSPVETRITLTQVRPQLVATRSASIDWKLNSNNGSLQPRFSVNFELKNTGTSTAIVNVGQEPPAAGVSNVMKSDTAPWSETEVKAGAAKKLTLSGTVDKGVQKLVIPAPTISYSDSKGNSYPYTAPGQLELKVSKGIFETIFDVTSGIYPWGQFVAALLIFISAWGLKTYGKENRHLTLAFGAIGIVALLIVVSALKVILL